MGHTRTFHSHSHRNAMSHYIASAPTFSDTPLDVTLSGKQGALKSGFPLPPAYSAPPPPPPGGPPLPPRPSSPPQHLPGPSTQQAGHVALADLPLSQRVDVVARQLDLETELVNDLLSWAGTEVVILWTTPVPCLALLTPKGGS